MTEQNPGTAALTRPVIRKGDTPTQEFPWGRITWTDNAEITGNQVLTFGLVQIDPGESNPPHYHPNCDEVLHVLEGELIHTLGPEEFHLHTGDTIHIPLGIRHQARNPGNIPCRMVVVYNTGTREVIGEF